jgi:hypothetical protein
MIKFCVNKHVTARQATDDNKANALFMLDTLGYHQTIRICNIYCFPTANNGCTNAPQCCAKRKSSVLSLHIRLRFQVAFHSYLHSVMLRPFTHLYIYNVIFLFLFELRSRVSVLLNPIQCRVLLFYRVIKRFCAPDDYSTGLLQKK